jgi:UDP-N-acetylglucosamine 2-epimerase (non-hydrolysing)
VKIVNVIGARPNFMKMAPIIDAMNRYPRTLGLIDRMGIQPKQYATLTLHRPSNVDSEATFRGILEALSTIARKVPVLFPIHPRTYKMAEKFGLTDFFTSGGQVAGIWITDPLGYLELLHLNMNVLMVLTDSGGLQEETTVLGVPCITLRNNTERPITCEVGTNFMVGSNPGRIIECADSIMHGNLPAGRVPDKWDGRAAERIVDAILASDEREYQS